MQENTTPDFNKLFEVVPSSPTGLRWKDNINDGITGRGKNLFAGKPAGVKKEITGRTRVRSNAEERSQERMDHR